MSAGPPVRARRAVIPAAGRGLRLMPLTRALPKALMPVADRPALHYLLDEMIAAGIADVCVIRAPHDAIATHFAVDGALEADHPPAAREELRRFRRQLRLSFVNGDADEPAWSLARVRAFVRDEPFVIALPDEILPSDGRLLVDMLDTSAALRASVAAFRGAADLPRVLRIDGPIEKRTASRAAAGSTPELIGRFVLQAHALERLDGTPASADFLDLLSSEALSGSLVGLRHDGPYWDIGTIPGYVRSFVELASL